ncbi:MAG: VPLPA-CTERM sorting domain-containing protein [Gammaproteobacteria bacterium]|nr:VPLPA-CTERM sorting domain-containing protein [Gammaproteobacteria bacterium]
MTSATFDMYDGTGALINVDTVVTGNIGGGAWDVASTQTFFGSIWTAHSGTTFGPGTYTFDTVEAGSITGVVVGAGQIGGHILFNWGATSDIDVVNVWDVTAGVYTSTDVVAGNPAGPNGTPGSGMIDGPFLTYEANFSFDTNPVPVPAAVWLFGSGLLGLVGVARRKKAA